MNNGAPRTLVLAAPYFPPHAGGLERYACEIVRRLKQSGEWRIVVVTSGELRGKDEKQNLDGLTIYRLGYGLKISNTPFGFLWFHKIRRILREEKPDIVNVHTPVPGLGDIAALFTRRKDLVVTYHSLSMRKGKLIPDALVWLYEHLLLPLLLLRAERIVCSSESVRSEFLSGYTNKSMTIPPGADHALFVPPPDGKRGEHTVLFVAAQLSRACAYKGLNTLIEAIAILHKGGLRARLVIVGDGDMRGEYEAMARARGLTGFVRFAGRLKGKKLAEVYQQASIFALPTSNDSYPIAILEAMAAGLPVVSTTVGDIPAIVEEGKSGFLIAPGDREALVDRLLMLLRDPKKAAALGRYGRRKAVKEFSWQERAARYRALFKELLAQSHPIIHCVGYYPPHMGGMERRVRDLATELANRGEEVTVLTSSIGARRGLQVQSNVEVFYLSSFQFAHTPIVPGLLPRLLAVPKGSILHLHVAQAFFPEIIALAAKLRGLPYIAHIRLLLAIPSGMFGKLLPAYSRFVLGPVLRGAKKIIVLTSGYQEILHTQFGIPFERIVVIPNATTFPRLGNARTRLHNPLRLLAVGRISVQKNYPFMLKVAESLKKDHKLNFTLTIVGPGAKHGELEVEARKRGIENEVRFVGEVTGAPLEKIYTDSDLFLHTSLAEGFGSVFLEAMAKGLPIIASDVIGTRDVIEHGRNGLLTPFLVEKMSEAIVRFSNDPKLYTQVSENNLEDVEKYSWKAITDQTLAVYEECAAELP